ncbi:bifunctional UDP-N-acetylmuramoyl-tripeptide:D-alanyl-D-alanine ligase/alanine racemase [Bacteroidota bacterium]
MSSFSTTDIARVIQAEKYAFHPAEVNEFSIDSRTIVHADKAIFFAIPGKHHDGHAYIQNLIEKGVKNFVVSDKSYISHQGSFMHVIDTVKALQKLAEYHRQKFSYPVIGITGSNGKTLIKEWLFEMLKGEFNVIRSPKSYNSQVGVPLSILLMHEDHNVAIIEAGISEPGEMERLEQIIKPTSGIISNIGDAHQENFSTIQSKASEKLKLLRNAENIIYCKDHHIIHEVCMNELQHDKLYGWSMKEKAFVQVTGVKKFSSKTEIHVKTNRQEYSFQIPFIDDASIENSIHIFTFLSALNLLNESILSRFSNLIPVEMRLEQKAGIHNCTIINDSYNSDINSIKIALDYLKMQNQHQKSTLIVSDILQSGLNRETLYKELNRLIINSNINRLIGIGKEISEHWEYFQKESSFFQTTSDFLNNISQFGFKNETILIKGARIFEFEKISGYLEEKTHKTILEINLNALLDNLNYFRSCLQPETKIMAMVKAFSYGSGKYELANLLQFQHIDYLGVAFTDEGIELRKAGITVPVMIMQAEIDSYESMIEYNLEPEIYNLKTLKSLISLLKEKNRANFPIHLKFDTGMHRMGFNPDDSGEIIKILKDEKSIKIRSVFSHLAASDEIQHDAFTREQLVKFVQIRKNFEKAFFYKILFHVLNSAGIERFPEYQYDMVRLGIGLYGISAIPGKKLAQISTLKSNIIQIKEIDDKETIGYGRKGIAKGKTRIGIIPIGYADGLNRKSGNGNWQVFINHQPASTIGNICMDVSMVDISNLNANEGDEVIIFGEENTVSEMAEKLGTISYEILTSISERVKRVYLKE